MAKVSTEIQKEKLVEKMEKVNQEHLIFADHVLALVKTFEDYKALREREWWKRKNVEAITFLFKKGWCC